MTRRGNRGEILLDDVHLKLQAGQRIALSGPAGCGKSLLLRALARLDQPDTGQVFRNDREVRGASVPSFRAATIYLHQQAALPEGTVESCLRQPFSFRHHRQRNVDPGLWTQWLHALGRDKRFLEKNLGDLSGGERQIVAIIRALQLEPQILLLDEPTAALDDSTEQAVEQLILDWQRQDKSRAYIWVTHNESQLARIADQTVFMKQGRIVEAQA